MILAGAIAARRVRSWSLAAEQASLLPLTARATVQPPAAAPAFGDELLHDYRTLVDSRSRFLAVKSHWETAAEGFEAGARDGPAEGRAELRSRASFCRGELATQFRSSRGSIPYSERTPGMGTELQGVDGTGEGAGSATTGTGDRTAEDSGGSEGGAETPSTGCGTTRELMNGRRTIQSGGMNREYILRVPDDYDDTRPEH